MYQSLTLLVCMIISSLGLILGDFLGVFGPQILRFYFSLAPKYSSRLQGEEQWGKEDFEDFKFLIQRRKIHI